MRDPWKAMTSDSDAGERTKHLNPVIYSNALPHYFDRIDLCNLDKEGDLFAYSFIEHLVKDQIFELRLSPSFETAEKLRHLYFESRNRERIKGHRSIAFGFPLFISGRKDQLNVSPVFIWSLQLEPASNNTEVWTITYNRDNPIQYNDSLSKKLAEKHGREVSAIFEKYTALPTFDSGNLLQAINELSTILCLDESFKNISICPCPTTDEIDTLAYEGAFYWSGVIGHFPNILNIPDDMEVDETPLFQTVLQSHEGHEFGLLDLDPYQASALKSVFRNKLTVVDGEAGTGKSHFLQYLLTNILLNKQRCLVIADSIPSLKELQVTFSDIGINQFHFLFRNIIQDKPLFQEFLRTAKEDAPKVKYPKDQLKILLDKVQRQKSKLDENYHALRKNVFGSVNWTETVGRYMKSNRFEGKELLSSQLNAQDFEFSFSEFEDLEQAIDDAYPLYLKVNTLKHPLRNLSKSIFTDLSKRDGLIFIEEQAGLYGEKATRLQQRIIGKLNLYKANLAEHYDDRYNELAAMVDKIKEKISDYSNRYGDRFTESGKGALRVIGVLSPKHKEALEAKEEVAGLFAHLMSLQKDKAYFDFTFSLASSENNMKKLRQELEQYEEELETWRTLHPAIVQEEITRLSSKNAHEKLYFEEQIISLENELDELITELNAAGLYDKPFANKMLTITRRQKYLEEIIEQLESSKLALRDYDHFYDWQHFWLALSERARKVIRALIKVKPQNWITAFESWYLDNVLTTTYDPALLAELDKLESYSENLKALKPLLKAQLSEIWENIQDEAIKKLRRRDKASYNLLFGKRKEGKDYPDIRSLFDADLDAVTATLPILMMPPHIALQLMPEVEAHFDFVIIDEAQYLPSSFASHLFSLGKKQVVLGSSAQVDPAYSSLMREVLNRGSRTYKLDQIHQFNPGNILQAFDATGFEDEMKQFEIHFAQADGRYDELEGTNDVEAQYIIRVLNQIKKTPQRTYPTVGIACFTVKQRNLITDYLLKIKQKRSPGAEKIQQLERNGLGIFCVDELIGQHFDILIVSGTFGTIDSRGNTGSQINWLNSGVGIAMVNLLTGRALKELFIVNSIPAEELEVLADQEENLGTFILSNYFLYARAWELSNKKEKRDILAKMVAWRKKSSVSLGELTFRKELAHAMQPYLEVGRIKEATQNGLSPYPLFVSGIREDKPAILLWPDGFASDTYSTDFSWEYQQIQDLRKKGLEHLPVWSANWWRNPQKEARRLASAIIKLDGDDIQD